MVEIAMVTIPNDSVFGIMHTGPFAFPCTGPFAAVIIEERRMNGVAQTHHAAVLEERLANEGGVVMGQLGNDRQMTADNTVASAGGGVPYMLEITFPPDRIGVHSADDER